jgi:hypothetical protein
MPTEDFEQEHLGVLSEAQVIFKKKSQVRGQMWLEFPPSDKIRELRERVSRIEHAYQARELELGERTTSTPDTDLLTAVMIDDALDILNYTAFFIKQLRRGHRG